jgi:hypothetical protein
MKLRLPCSIKNGESLDYPSDCWFLATLPPSVSRLSRQNVGASTSHNPMGLHGLLQGYLYLYLLLFSIGNIFEHNVVQTREANNHTSKLEKFMCFFGLKI